MLEKDKFFFRTFLFTFWIGMSYGFVSEEILPFLIPFRNAILIVVDIVIIVLSFALIRTKRDITFILSFFAIAVISNFFLNRLGSLPFFNGIRDFIGLLFVIPILRYFLTGKNAYKYKNEFDRQLRIWLLLQAVCLVFQFIKYGANDHGGGTMGDGGSGMVSTLIYLVSYYLVIQKWDYSDYKKSFLENKWYFIALIPTYLNETKVSFVLIIVYFALLYKPTRASIFKIIYFIPIFIILVIGLAKVYINATQQDADEVFSWEFINEYLVGEDVYYYVDLALLIQDGYFDDDMEDVETAWAIDIQRLSKLILVIDPLKSTGGGLLFGAGLGQFKGGTIVDMTPFMKEYKWLLQGSRPWIFFVGVQLGLLGLIWFFWTFFVNMYKGYIKNQKTKKVNILLLTAFLIMMIYNDAFRYYYFCMCYFYVMMAIRLTEKENAQIESEDVDKLSLIHAR